MFCGKCGLKIGENENKCKACGWDVPNIEDIVTQILEDKAETIMSAAYKIGSTGPAGGFVFYDKGEFSDGWQYLESAPANTEFTGQWGTYSLGGVLMIKGIEVSGTSEALGSGKANTQLILDVLKENNERGRVAQMVTQLNINGFTDWFLPSKKELDLMYKNLKACGLGNFNKGFYWSSSQSNRSFAWVQRFSDGDQSNYSKNNPCAVRAARAF